MKRPIHLAIAATLLVFGAYAVAQTGARPPKPPTVVKPAGAGVPNTKVLSTPSSGAAKVNAAAKVNMNTGAAMKAEKAQGAGSLAPPPPGNAAIKGDAGAIKGSSTGKFSDESPKERGAAMKAQKAQGAAAIKGESAITGSGAIKGESAAIKGNSAITGSGAITGGTMKADKAQGAIKGAPAGALNSPRDPAMR